jgi:hypothetical protein
MKNLLLVLGVAVAACSSGGADQPTGPGESTVTPPGAPFSCTSSQVLSLNVGEVRAGLSGGQVCLNATAGADYMITAFSGSQSPSSNTQVSMTGYGIGAASAAALNQAAPGSGPTDLEGRPIGMSRDLAFREAERGVLAAKIPGARAWYRNRRNSATLVTTAPTVGSQVTLNTTSDSSSCHTTKLKSAHVVAVSSTAIVVADDENPGGGFTQAEYASVAAAFDTLVDPLDRSNFGNPTDLDDNGRVIIFYTVEVNKLTPRGSQGVVEGFFNPRDIFPTTSNAQLEGCPGSNVAEMFYMIVPDPNATVSDARSKAEVFNNTIAVTAHEYQHLINSTRRLYVNDADDFEEVWLNEGLSHIAEELLFYRTSGLKPRSNLDAAQITTSQPRVDAFNQHAADDLVRYSLYLEKPEQSSPYADNDSLENRGAIWSFLRYAADRKAITDAGIWSALVNSKTTGFANLQNVFGADLMSWFRDWSISNYTDDKANTGDTWQQISWNFRDIFPRIGITPYPLHVRTMTTGTALSSTLDGGGSVYAVFGVAPGTTAGIQWSAASTTAISVVRVR